MREVMVHGHLVMFFAPTVPVHVVIQLLNWYHQPICKLQGRCKLRDLKPFKRRYRPHFWRLQPRGRPSIMFDTESMQSAQHWLLGKNLSHPCRIWGVTLLKRRENMLCDVRGCAMKFVWKTTAQATFYGIQCPRPAFQTRR